MGLLLPDTLQHTPNGSIQSEADHRSQQVVENIIHLHYASAQDELHNLNQDSHGKSREVCDPEPPADSYPCRQEKAERQTKTAPGLEEWVQEYKQAHRRNTFDKLEMRNLIFPWMTEGYDIGLLAPTDCGKTTLVLQVAMALSKGTCDNPISPQYGSIKPIRALVFSLEQSEMEINTYYGNVLSRERLLTIRGGEWLGENPTAQIFMLII